MTLKKKMNFIASRLSNKYGTENVFKEIWICSNANEYESKKLRFIKIF